MNVFFCWKSHRLTKYAYDPEDRTTISYTVSLTIGYVFNLPVSVLYYLEIELGSNYSMISACWAGSTCPLNIVNIELIVLGTVRVLRSPTYSSYLSLYLLIYIAFPSVPFLFSIKIPLSSLCFSSVGAATPGVLQSTGAGFHSPLCGSLASPLYF